ncbi:MAG: PHP domain-containing protein, partial [Clostridia bacterium]|nr:PHP domain-containing protein [Clostridia bacterium]
MKADLHLHTTASDGSLTPAELTALAAREGFDVIAVSDHDSVSGVLAAQEAGKQLGVSVIPAVELSCGAAKEIHILGYGIDIRNEALLDFCRARRENREARARQMCEQLAQEGKSISFDRVMELARGVVGRPHVARALLEAGHVSSIRDAFDRFLVPGKPGYVPKEDVKVADAVSLIRAAGGAAVLAHPMELKMGEMALEALIREWKTQGLDGIEVWHPSAANNHAAYLERLARREELLITGGCDYHGPLVHDALIGEGLDRWKTVDQDIRTLYGRIAC